MITSEKLITYHEAKGHKNNTRALIRCAVRHWNRLRLGKPDSEPMTRFRDARLKEGASPETVRGELNKLVSLAKWLGHDPIVRKPSKVHRAPLAWDYRQLRRLFREARTTNRVIYGLPGKIFWPAILGTCYDTGERIGAVISLKWKDIDYGNRSVYYAAEIRKGGYRDAVGSLSRGTCRDLRRLHDAITRCPSRTIPAESDKVFMLGSGSNLWKAYTRILADAGLPTDRRSKFHRLRRTHATYVSLAGGDATAALGHSTDEVTRESYLDPRMRKKVKMFSPRGNGITNWLTGWIRS